MSRRRATPLIAPLIAALAASCSNGGAPSAPDAGPEASTSASAARIRAVLEAEHRRAPVLVTAEDQQSRDVSLRRAAARALARIGGDGARTGLLRALSDEDGDVVAWAAYGLGFFCKGHDKATVAALVARALTPTVKTGALDPDLAIARAIGRCGAEESEPTLTAWLAGPKERAVSAAYGLSEISASKKKLREETIAALLNTAAGSASSPSLPEALAPIGRLRGVPPTVVARIGEVATAALAHPGPSRIFAVRALLHGGEGAAAELGKVLRTPATFNAAERAEAARVLGERDDIGAREVPGSARPTRRADAGKHALEEALPELVPNVSPVAITGLVSEDFGVIMRALNAIKPSHLWTNKPEFGGPSVEPPSAAAKKALVDLASLPVPAGAPPAIVRRVAWLRCKAADRLAGADHKDKLLVACDPITPSDPSDARAPSGLRPAEIYAGSIGLRAMVDVLGRARLVGPRLAAFAAIADGKDTRARAAALELLADHEEVESSADLLARALRSEATGVSGTAAEVLKKQPQRAAEAPKQTNKKAKRKRKRDGEDVVPDEPRPISPALIEALLAALAKPIVNDDPEIADALVAAAGALGAKAAKARIDELCRSPHPTTREQAEIALGLLGDKKACPAPAEGGPLPSELDHLVTSKVTLSIESDAGALTLTLDPAFAPVMVTRLKDLAQAGFFDAMVVHRVEGGFVTQLGSPWGDGSGGPFGKPALRCETSPLPFNALTVGVALSGRDTGGSQIFVMHASAPHLDGAYPLVGTAKGPWAAFVDGDRITKVKVE